SEAFHLSNTAEALWRLPCQWKRIIGSPSDSASPFSKKIEKTHRSLKMCSKQQKRGQKALFYLSISFSFK
ncbi:hypothetical protein, partial [Vibrio sp. SCSIO 43169]